ncbi:hypothetical protein MNB_SV-13-810 [hydrothermal vent metagenome]|uniref:Response regulatory domain-containing protein n=1 Tax=hydrothermal vent metagenome TaxID=652676 RepID=A0A1W1CR41_9ZZZZ
MGYSIKIVEEINHLEYLIQDKNYDMLFIDENLKEFNKNILQKQHSLMNVIILSSNDRNNEHYNKKIIKEVLSGIITRSKIEQIIKKYKR